MQQKGRTIVLSIKPHYAKLILDGSKTVEFRRRWAVEPIVRIAIYASSPIKKIVGMVSVKQVIQAKPNALWSLCSRHGGGLTRRELYSYFKAKETGYAVVLGEKQFFSEGIDPCRIMDNFSPPQSFRYMVRSEVLKLEKLAELQIGKL